MSAVYLCPTRNTLFLTTAEKGLCVHIDVIVLKAMCNVQVWRVDGQAQTKQQKTNLKKMKNHMFSHVVVEMSTPWERRGLEWGARARGGR